MKKYFLRYSIVAIMSFLGTRSMAQNIYTFAGIAGANGYTGDDSLATIAKLSGPAGIACNAAGVVYFADTRNNAVRKVNTSGIISTIAGTGTAGYSGDGGAATAAQLRNPAGIAIDGIGNVYITDTRNSVVRKVDTFGIITTIAGTGTAGYTGDGGDATAAELNRPTGIALDGSGNIFISDSRNQVVREIFATGTFTITTIAGNNTPGYTGDGGPATAAQLSTPQGIAVTAAGKLYIADSRNNVIRMVNAGVINTFAGTGGSGHSGDGGPATAANLYSPGDVKVDAAGNVFIADSSNTVRIVNTGDTIRDYAGTGVVGYNGDGGPATAARMIAPDGLAIDAAHNVYISALGNNVIRRVGAAVTGIYITSNTGDTSCIGHVTDFTATPVADATPHYQWQQNGINVGTDNILYTPTSLAAGDIISCILLTAPGGSMLAISNNIRVDSLPRSGTINGPAVFCIGGVANFTNVGGTPGGTWKSSNTTIATIAPPSRVTGAGTGIAKIYYILSNVCGTDTASKTIKVDLNNIGAVTGPADVCAGATVTYTDTTTSGKWRVRPGFFGAIDSSTGVFTAGPIPGTVTIIYATSPTCSRVDTIRIDSLPVNAAITGPSTVDSGGTITLADANAGGAWSSGNTTIATVDPTGIVTGIASGTVDITYTITNTAGCTADTTYSITVINTSGINKIQNTASFCIFPNPASGNLNVSWANIGSGKSSVAISDVSGRTVFVSEITMNNTKGQAKLDISTLETGVYMLTIKSEQGFYCGKLVIE